MNHPWNTNERNAIGSRYGELAFFAALRFVALRCGEEAERLRLAPAELFYHTVYGLDSLKGCPDKPGRREICRLLWLDVFDCLREAADAEARETADAASLVTLATAISLFAADRLTFHDEIAALLASAAEPGRTRPTYERRLEMMRTLNENITDKPPARIWLGGYLAERTYFLSDEIEELLINLRDEAARSAIARGGGTFYFNSTHNDNQRIMNASASLTDTDAMARRIAK